jgi:hypothetical protein
MLSRAALGGLPVLVGNNHQPTSVAQPWHTTAQSI